MPFTFLYGCDIIIVPNKLNMQIKGVFSCLGILIPFLEMLFIMLNLIKCKFHV